MPRYKRVKMGGGRKGIDGIFDPVGGCYLVLGFTAGEVPRISLNLSLLKGCSRVGVFWGAFTEHELPPNRENIQELLSWFEEGKIKTPLSNTYLLVQTANGLTARMERKIIGKAVVLASE